MILDQSDFDDDFQSTWRLKFAQQRQTPQTHEIVLLHFPIIFMYLLIGIFYALDLSPVVIFYSCIYTSDFTLPLIYILYSSLANWKQQLTEQSKHFQAHRARVYMAVFLGLVVPITFLYFFSVFLPFGLPSWWSRLTLYDKVLVPIVYIVIVPICSVVTWKFILTQGLTHYFVKRSGISESKASLWASVYFMMVQSGYKIMAIQLYVEDRNYNIILSVFVPVLVALQEFGKSLGLGTALGARIGINISVTVFVIWQCY